MDVLDIRCKKAVLTNDDILKIIEKNLGKKYVNKIEITNNADGIIEIMQKRYGISKANGHNILENCTAIAPPRNTKKKKQFYL